VTCRANWKCRIAGARRDQPPRRARTRDGADSIHAAEGKLSARMHINLPLAKAYAPSSTPADN